MPIMTRSSVLGKRHAPSELSIPSSPTSANESKECGLLTPDSTPSAKRARIASPIFDDGSNKENIPPFRLEVINSSPEHPRTPRALRRTSTALDSSPSRRSMWILVRFFSVLNCHPAPRRHASTSHLRPNLTTPASAISGLSLTTPPPSPPSILLPISARARALLRVTSNSASSITGREKERNVIQDFVRSLIGSNSEIEKSSLYISGSPGSGKTALVASILRNLRSELDNADVTVVTLNCMALGSIDALWVRLSEAFEEVQASPTKTRTKAKTTPDECFRRLLSGKHRR